MSDDKTNRGGQDRSGINLSEDHEVPYWTEALCVSDQRLRNAVAEVGDSADRVRAFVGAKS